MWLKKPQHLTQRIGRIRCWKADELFSEPRRRMQGIFLFSVTSVPVREDCILITNLMHWLLFIH